MKAFSLRVIALASLPAFGACADTATTQDPQGYKITVAPLDLVGIGDACYDILIENSTPDGVVAAANNVVSLTDICASQYGNGAGGDVTYIAPCDASSATNFVTIWPTLFEEDGTTPLGAGTWENPCGTAGCQLERPCVENADTLVEFNLTVMRDAEQGFFDVAVNFTDIFCSAKVDCQYEDNSYIRLVHNASGDRTATAVVAFSCTDGNFGGASTQLYASNIQVSCDADGAGPTAPVVYEVLTDAAGNGVGAQGPIAQSMVFMGTEALQVDGQDAGKVYWNTAIGFSEVGTANPPQLVAGAENCELKFWATASQGPLNLVAGESYLSHPFLVASVPLTNATAAMTCSQHPINSTAFTTVYDDAFPADIEWTLNGTQADAGQAVSTLPAP